MGPEGAQGDPEARLIEAFLARRDAELDPRHPLGARLAALARALEAESVTPPTRDLLERTLRGARAELRATRRPETYGRALLRLLAAASIPLPFAAAWSFAVLSLAPEWLSAWLPPPLAWALPAAYVFGSAGWLAVLFGSLPILAHRDLTRRLRDTI